MGSSTLRSDAASSNPMKNSAEAIETPRMTGKSRLISGLALIVGILALARYLDARTLLQDSLHWIQGLGPWGLIVFVLLYIAAAVFFLPAFILTLGAGAIYGVLRGTALVSVAATLAATTAFLVGRYFARDWVAKRIEGNPTFLAIDEAIARDGWKIVGLIRLSPAFPFVLLNYAFSLTRVSAKHYIIATWIGMTPAILMYVYLGSLAGSLVAIGAGQRTRTPAEWAFYALGLVATVAVTVTVTRIARRTLRRRIARVSGTSGRRARGS
jgi:uncharacterized membrane protein YdjX (TVP38/TMEM64 family)